MPASVDDGAHDAAMHLQFHPAERDFALTEGKRHPYPTLRLVWTVDEPRFGSSTELRSGRLARFGADPNHRTDGAAAPAGIDRPLSACLLRRTCLDHPDTIWSPTLQLT